MTRIKLSTPTFLLPSIPPGNILSPFRPSRDAGELLLCNPIVLYIMVDIKSDGPIPGDYSVICFGSGIVEPELTRTFCGTVDDAHGDAEALLQTKEM